MREQGILFVLLYQNHVWPITVRTRLLQDQIPHTPVFVGVYLFGQGGEDGFDLVCASDEMPFSPYQSCPP